MLSLALDLNHSQIFKNLYPYWDQTWKGWEATAKDADVQRTSMMQSSAM